MPYKDPSARRLAARDRQRKRRARLKAEKAKATRPPAPVLTVVADPVQELADWAASELIVPPGHPRAGEPMALPDFAVDFLKASWTAHESALSVGRKNAKSAICAVLALGHLVGPLRSVGWRGAVASLSVGKAAELRTQIVQIAEASGLDVHARRSPYPGSIEAAGGSFDTLSADRSAGHASGYDLVIADETGLMPERARELLAGLRSSVSARGGRVTHISVKGDSPLFVEILSNPATVKRVYAAPDDCPIDDQAAWEAANPGLAAGIKQRDYMAAEVNRIRSGAPTDEPSFRAFDLNQSLSPTREMIFSPDDLRACFMEDPPARSGVCYLGFDFGETVSASAACAIWPETGRLETWMAFGDIPALKDRARADSAPYLEMERRGELKTYPGRDVRVADFLGDVAADLKGVHVQATAADSHKDAEAQDFLDQAGLRWLADFRRVGAGKQGSADIRALQRLVIRERLKMKPNLSFATAIAKSIMRRDPNGNPAVDKSTSRGRIDVLSAAVIAAGLAEPEFDRPARPSLVWIGRA